MLDSFSRDITKLALENKLDPIIGRDREIERLSQILTRRKEPVRRLRLANDGTPLPDDLAPGVFYRDAAIPKNTLLTINKCYRA